jgi:hypothetical protein
VPRSGEGIFEAQRAFADVAKELGMPVLFPNALQTGVNWYQFSFIMGTGFGLGTDDNTPEGKKKAARALRRILEENAKRGFGDYRAPAILQDDVADQFVQQSRATPFPRDAERCCRSERDPFPGRAGVWPAAYRSLRGALRV